MEKKCLKINTKGQDSEIERLNLNYEDTSNANKNTQIIN